MLKLLKETNLISLLAMCYLVSLLSSCATPGGSRGKGRKSSSRKSSRSTSSSSSSGGRQDNANEDSTESEADNDFIGANVDSSSYVHSLSDNKLTSYVSNGSGARNHAAKLNGKSLKDLKKAKRVLESLIAAERIADAPVGRLQSYMKRLANIQLKRGLNGKVGDAPKLEVAIAALKQRRFGLAIFFLEELFKSKNRRIRAGAYNTMGILVKNDGRIPEAVQYWREALKAVPGYEAALLNLGFVSLRYAAFGDAKKMLGRIKKNWFVKSGQLVASRLTGSTSKTSRLCDDVLEEKPNHKPTIFNCGVHEWQSNKDTKKARAMITKALRMSGGPSRWESTGYNTLESIP